MRMTRAPGSERRQADLARSRYADPNEHSTSPSSRPSGRGTYWVGDSVPLRGAAAVRLRHPRGTGRARRPCRTRRLRTRVPECSESGRHQLRHRFRSRRCSTSGGVSPCCAASRCPRKNKTSCAAPRQATSPGYRNRPATGPSDALNDYQILWVDYAREQYLTLGEHARGELDTHLALLAQDPTATARYDPGTDRWSSEFDGGLVSAMPDQRRQASDRHPPESCTSPNPRAGSMNRPPCRRGQRAMSQWTQPGIGHRGGCPIGRPMCVVISRLLSVESGPPAGGFWLGPGLSSSSSRTQPSPC